MNILFLLRYIDSGGITRVINDSTNFLIKEGCKIYIVYGSFIGRNNSFESLLRHNPNIKLIQIPALVLNLKHLLLLPFTLFRIILLIIKYRINVVHVHWLSLSFICKIIYKTIKVPFVTTTHLINKKSSSLFRFYSDFNIVISSELEEWLIHNEKIPKESIYKIYNSVNPIDFPFIDQTQKRKIKLKSGFGGVFVILCLARFESIKRHDILLRAVSMLDKTKYLLLLGGEGILENEIRNQVKHLNLSSNVRFLGHIDSSKIMQISDVIVLTSDQEGSPMSIIEGMMSGVLPIRTNSEAAKDQIDHGVNGFIIEKGDYNTLYCYLNELIGGKYNINEMSKSAHKHSIEQFNFETNQHKILNIYKTCKYDWI